MNNLVILAAVGFLAQLIDGALGMGYGVTSTSVLLTFGLTPASVSASVHAGEVVTTLVSGISHWRFGNLDFDMTWRLAVPGAVGAFLGAVFLTSIPVHLARPGVSAFLVLLGIVVLVRFLRPQQSKVVQAKSFPRKLLTPLGFVAGFLDASGGGGWGPVSTSTLIAHQGNEARKVIGSVDASEFLVAISATIGFVLALGWEGMNIPWIIAIVIGGAVAAPMAAWAVRVIPTRILGVTVGMMILLSNIRLVLSPFGLDIPMTVVFPLMIVPVILVVLTMKLKRDEKPTRLSGDVEKLG